MDFIVVLWWFGVVLAALAAGLALVAPKVGQKMESAYLWSYILMSLSMIVVVARSVI